ncbi:MAG: hypothetical protein LUE92_13655 [Clostridiales bacterium]|nr:hypothetical protein [Clostridiales bacterium]
MSENFLIRFEDGKIYLEYPKVCWMSGKDFGRNRIFFTDECNISDCMGCERRIRFYSRVHELEKQGVPFDEAVGRAEEERLNRGKENHG